MPIPTPEKNDVVAVTEEIKTMLKNADLFRQQCYINGEWLDADSGVTVPVTNPANGNVLGHVPKMGSAETRRAIEAANAAWPAWRARTAKERGAVLRRWFDLLMANQEDLAKLMTAEQGKPLAESRGEIAYGASFVEWFATSCDHGSRLAWSGLMAYGLWIVKGSNVAKFEGSSVDQTHTALTIR